MRPLTGSFTLGRNLGQRLEHEAPFAEPRVRHGELRFVDQLLAEQDQVEVERPCRSGIRPLAPGIALDLLQRRQQLPRLEPGLSNGRCIQESRLIAGHSDWICFVV